MKNNKSMFKSLITFAVIVAVYLVLSTLINGKVINSYYSGILVLAFINIILAVSLNLVVGFTGQLALGHAGFMAIGAYLSAYLSKTYHLPFILVLVLGGLLASALALIVGVPTLKLKGDYFAITTLAFGEIIKGIITNTDLIGGARGLSGIPRNTNFSWAFIIMVLSVLVIYNIIHSSPGRAMISVRENEIAAEAMGINTFKYKLLAFIIAAFIAGVAGGLYAHYYTFIQPQSFNFMKSIEILTFVVFGGMGSLSGSVIATFILTALPEALRSLQDFKNIIYPVALIALMIFRPEGLLGTKEISFNIFKKLSPQKGKEE
ncbi:branched-chain amino acid ABC transporter permease [Clostridium intestinale]|uniref:Branched-chain amino acid transport system permease protein n=1 Tax=Clostridium intestinale DSM 6191 TaxID=1121320 RepID=A0A1M5WSH0_9CLOT|nr:branched-chain amino acid ABC transporter permease [Clostridium intestinale]SHH90332.1 branched-chain amino acid transport system permease protein [Clostridium intestinale DSM 6191]